MQPERKVGTFWWEYEAEIVNAIQAWFEESNNASLQGAFKKALAEGLPGATFKELLIDANEDEVITGFRFEIEGHYFYVALVNSNYVCRHYVPEEA